MTESGFVDGSPAEVRTRIDLLPADAEYGTLPFRSRTLGSEDLNDIGGVRVNDPRGPATRRRVNTPIDAAVIFPPFDKPFVAHEHPEEELGWLGDSLGVDLMVVRFVDGWARTYAGDGSRNEDWFGWMHDVLAPCDGTARHTQASGSANAPGTHSGGKPGGIIFERQDGVFIAYGHVQGIAVVPGQRVRAGDVVAKVGNDGTSWHPHLHVGAWNDSTPLQIRIDLAVRGTMLREQGEARYWGVAR